MRSETARMGHNIHNSNISSGLSLKYFAVHYFCWNCVKITKKEQLSKHCHLIQLALFMAGKAYFPHLKLHWCVKMEADFSIIKTGEIFTISKCFM